MLDVQTIHHVSVCVRDLEKAKSFYGGKLGLTEIERPPFDFSGAWYAVGASGQQLHLIVHNGETLREGPIDTRDGHFALRVASYKAARLWLESQGIPYEARPHARAGFPQIYVLDPDHNVIELNADVCDEE
ncbi:Glyoxalase-like domain protein [Paenibacillus konkukensis]|uniref:Glyoxalase-like domain protein n=1 Tax=Paenibacillus konkukensis TaxID=2020716 RepID=A0ABY4RLK8_9BACL|nr:VOC family protein [Paenibacillus konkukensis]UQZ83386.1 Glyoxalase-like domain protein [Paenibacillus konkukensis]